MSGRDGRQQVEAELRAFREHCRQAGFSEAEMAEICRPLGAAASKAGIKLRLRIPTAIFLLACLIYWLADADSLNWHASALGRILMIRILPLWDWRSLFFERCLLDATQIKEPTNSLTVSDCAACEAVGLIPHMANANYDDILNRHLIRGTPVIITDANLDRAKDADLNLTRVLSDDERLRDSVPCSLETNLRAGHQPADVNDLFAKIHKHSIPNWFMHFQNCDLQAVKSLRVLAPRPYFLSPHVPPAHFNWLLMSDKYASPRFKPLELDVGLIVVSQLRGGNLIRLKPRAPCGELCPTQSFGLREGETLVLANSLWNFEYSPMENSQNTAILTETAWNEA